MGLRATLRRWLVPVPLDSALLDARVLATERHVTALYDEVRQLRVELRALAGTMVQLQTDEARRAAEHATMVDALDRLYKRVSARIARESPAAAEDVNRAESVMDMRRRLGR